MTDTTDLEMTDEQAVAYRAEMVANIVRLHSREPLTVEALASWFPPDFQLGDDDLEPHKPVVVPPPTEIGQYVAASKIDAPDEFDAEPEVKRYTATEVRERQAERLAQVEKAADPTPQATPEEIAAAVQRVEQAERDLWDARRLQMVENDQERALNAKLSTVVQTFQSGFAPVTRDQLMRDYIASEQARKLAGDVRVKQHRPGKSYFDRMRFPGRSDVNDAARGYRPLTHAQAQALCPGSTGGGSKGNARGSFPASYQQGPAKTKGEAPMKLGARYVPKVPSAR